MHIINSYLCIIPHHHRTHDGFVLQNCSLHLKKIGRHFYEMFIESKIIIVNFFLGPRSIRNGTEWYNGTEWSKKLDFNDRQISRKFNDNTLVVCVHTLIHCCSQDIFFAINWYSFCLLSTSNIVLIISNNFCHGTS